MKLQLKQDWPLYLIITGIIILVTKESVDSPGQSGPAEIKKEIPEYWEAPSLFLDAVTAGEERQQVIYGEELIARTSRYFGPNGSISHTTNGMNCQNCHLQAGQKPWGNNYGAVFSTYPKLRDRSGTIETIPKRVNDCFERSLNGKAIDTNGKEMLAIVAYIKWLGRDVQRGEKPAGSGITELPFMNRAADPVKGGLVYTAKCQSCHGENGEGLLSGDSEGYAFPPLWGEHSYNTGAGLYRLSRFAGYVKDNMPVEQASHKSPVLTNEEAWDVAAFVNSQQRPVKDLSKDWPDISKKPVDHPFGPYSDGFSEIQHKYGPFQVIVDARKKQKNEGKLREHYISKR